MRRAQVYDSTKQLRYGHLMIMTDQDHDGSHIKGLIMNFLHHFYPSLLQVPGFLLEFITPIVKVRRLLLSTRQLLLSGAVCTVRSISYDWRAFCWRSKGRQHSDVCQIRPQPAPTNVRDMNCC